MKNSNNLMVEGLIMAVVFGVIAATIISARPVAGQQAVIYSSDGRRIGTAEIDSQGTTTTRDAQGRVVSRETGPTDRRYPESAPADPRKPQSCPFRPECFEVRQY